MKRMTFEGNGLDYFKIWIINVCVTLITFGLYYPWAKVRTRRYFYANTTCDNRHFEFHATGKQLFAGYILSVGMLILFLTLQSLFPIANLVLGYVFGLAVPWIIWRSIKFNNRMTSFSNIRLSFDSSAGGAVRPYVGKPIMFYTIASISVIGMIITSRSLLDAYPQLFVLTIQAALLMCFISMTLLSYASMVNRKVQYGIAGLRYGQMAFKTQLKTLHFARIALLTLLLALTCGMLVIGAVVIMTKATGTFDHVASALQLLESPTDQSLTTSNAKIRIGLLLVVLLLIKQVATAYFYSRKRAYTFGHTHIGNDISFQSTLGARQYAWITTSNVVCIILTLGLAIPWARIRVARLLASNTLIDAPLGLDKVVAHLQDTQSSLGEQIGDAFAVEIDFSV